MIASEGPAVAMCTHVSLEFALPHERAFTQSAFVRFGHARSMSPPVLVEIPLGVELLATNYTPELFDSPMLFHVGPQ